MNDDVTYSAIRGHVRDLETIAATYGHKMPEGYLRSHAIATEATRLSGQGHGVITLDGLPDTVAKVETYLRKVGIERAAQREAALAARELADIAERESLRLGLSEAPHVLALVADAFAQAAEQFAEAVNTAPNSINAHTTPEEFSEHATLLGCVDRLSMAAGFRVRLSQIMREELRGEQNVWTLLDPKPAASCVAIRQLLGDYAEAMPSTLEDWSRFNALGMSLAAPGEADARAQRFGAALANAGMTTADKGMLDRTYGEVVAMVGGAAR